MRAWLISRQQQPSAKQTLPDFSNRKDLARYPAQYDRPQGSDLLEDDAAIHVRKRLDVVPRRCGQLAHAGDDDGFWASHMFWKGIVFGVVVVVLAKTVFHVQTPFGIDWYGF